MNKINKMIMPYFWKLLICSISLTIGVVFLGTTIPFPGFSSFAITTGTDSIQGILWLFLVGMILTLVLSSISSRLHAGWLVRWGLLAEVTWICGAVLLVANGFYDAKGWSISWFAISLFSLFSFLLPSLILSAMVAMLFQPHISDQIPHKEPFPPLKAANRILRIPLDGIAQVHKDPFIRPATPGVPPAKP